MRVLRHETANSLVRSGRPPRTLQKKIVAKVKSRIYDLSIRNWHTENPIMHSFGRTSAGIVEEINQSHSQIVNLHWVSDLLSIEDIGRIRKPIVWTVHDMWVFCGGEHSTPDTPTARFREGYLANNRPQTERGPDLNRIAWDAKMHAWNQMQITFVTPSRWMAGCLTESALFKNASVSTHVVPNPLDVDTVWRPLNKQLARARLGLNPTRRYVLCGSAGGMSTIKGEDMLPTIAERLSARYQDSVELIVFGRDRALPHEQWSGKVHWMGRVMSDAVMVDLYSAADVMVVPSRQDNLPNTAVEAMACGTPVVGFEIGGLPDIVDHAQTGWIASPFDLDSFVQGISWLLDDDQRYLLVAAQSRAAAVNKFGSDVIAKKYLEIYQQALALSAES